LTRGIPTGTSRSSTIETTGPQWIGYNVNGLTDDENFNEITGNAGFGDMMVAIDRVDLAL